MKAEEKAKELVDRFDEYTESEYMITQDEPNRWRAKQCALICVEEILDFEGMPHTAVEVKIWEYWQDVKKEIEKL